MTVLELFSKRRSRSVAFRALVSDGDNARDRRDWASALVSYRSALELKRDRGISIQAAHCLKELKSYDEAFSIYAWAEAKKPRDDDLQLQIGHLEKLRGNNSAALARYKKALALNASNNFVRQEIAEMERRIAVSFPPSFEIYSLDSNTISPGEPVQEVEKGAAITWVPLSSNMSSLSSPATRDFNKRYEEILSSLRKFR